MSQEKKNSRELDDFWDISALVPTPTRNSYGVAPSTDSVSIQVTSSNRTLSQESTEQQGTVIKRYVPPNTDDRLSSAKLQFDSCERYCPNDSLIHTVELKKWKCNYRYYHEFYQDAISNLDVIGSPCDFVPFFSYVPQYNQLNPAQRAFYFWFRENARQGIYIQTDYCYVLLYVYELLNLGNVVDVCQSQKQLMGIWHAYHKTYPALENKLPEWICDFGLLHRLPPPLQADGVFLQHVISLKEYFIPMPPDDIERCARSLLRFCCSYDFHTSKFFQGNEQLFEQHMLAILIRAVRFYSGNGQLLSKLTFDDSRLIRDAYAGALCVAEQKIRIELEYCSFSRSNELRFLIGDVIKYAENKIRSYLGIKSKMTVYSISVELRTVLDAYFEQALPKRKKAETVRKEAYEALYDVPLKPLSLTQAAQIERDSWKTTRDLVEAFEEIEPGIPISEFNPNPPINSMEIDLEGSQVSSEEEPSDLQTSLGEWYGVVLQLLRGDTEAFFKAARDAQMLPDALADRINELAFSCIGDSILEELDGGYCVIEDYKELLET